MAITIDISMESQCAGGGHIRLRNHVDGNVKTPIAVETDEIRGQLSEEEQATLVTLLTKAKLRGLNRTQARNTLNAGFTVTIA